MSHKQAKAKRKQVRKLIPNILTLPKAAYATKIAFPDMSTKDLNKYIKRTGKVPYITKLTKECQKYWYKK